MYLLKSQGCVLRFKGSKVACEPGHWDDMASDSNMNGSYPLLSVLETSHTQTHTHTHTHTHTIIIIMYIYHALINALSAHMIHINLNMIFYTHVEHSPTKTICIKYLIIIKFKKRTTNTHTHTHTDCSKNWVLILVRMEIL